MVACPTVPLDQHDLSLALAQHAGRTRLLVGRGGDAVAIEKTKSCKNSLSGISCHNGLVGVQTYSTHNAACFFKNL